MIPLPVATRTRLQKVAKDTGFDLALPSAAGEGGPWLSFASTHCPLRIWLGQFGEAVFLVAFSRQNVARTIGPYGTPMLGPLPDGAMGGVTVVDIPSLYRLLRRSFQLANTLPDELLHVFERETAALPRATEVERREVQRVGQGIFRGGLLDYWEGRCAMTGLAVPELLRASHIKPWADCATDRERLDVFNGLLLAPHLDAAFDRGFITVEDDGAVVVSSLVDDVARGLLMLASALRVQTLREQHRAYLAWHRARVFRPSMV